MKYNKKDLIKSPLNYTGGKYRLLSKILPLFPEQIETFVDLFCGGLNVGININANKIIANDLESHVIDFYKNLQNVNGDLAHAKVMELVDKYSLSKTNQDGFLKLRRDYNKNKTWDKFYAVVSHAFNYQIRYNNSGDYNMPFGKDRSSYNKSLQSKLISFTNGINDKDFIFKNEDFRDIHFDYDNSYFLYADPPYLISTASYNENGGWTEKDEKDLLDYLDSINELGSKFALSNVFEHKGRSNDTLKEWAKKHNIHYLNYDYKNCSYHGKNTNSPTIEVLVTNY